jgi:ATP-binding cassette subfamily C protein LapB
VLGAWLKDRTLVLSTHRLQLLVWVERIALMDQGRILLEGPREEMLKKLSTGVSQKEGHTRSSKKPANPNPDAPPSSPPLAPAAV